MKKMMIVFVVSLASFAVQAAESTVFTVNGMVCAFCAQGIEKKLKKMPETQAVMVDLAAKTVIVEAKSGMSVPVDKVILEIKDAGYDVTGSKVVAESVEMLRNKTKTKEVNHE
jgi:cation transport ATPase